MLNKEKTLSSALRGVVSVFDGIRGGVRPRFVLPGDSVALPGAGVKSHRSTRRLGTMGDEEVKRQIDEQSAYLRRLANDPKFDPTAALKIEQQQSYHLRRLAESEFNRMNEQIAAAVGLRRLAESEFNRMNEQIAAAVGAMPPPTVMDSYLRSLQPALDSIARQSRSLQAAFDSVAAMGARFQAAFDSVAAMTRHPLLPRNPFLEAMAEQTAAFRHLPMGHPQSSAAIVRKPRHRELVDELSALPDNERMAALHEWTAAEAERLPDKQRAAFLMELFKRVAPSSERTQSGLFVAHFEVHHHHHYGVPIAQAGPGALSDGDKLLTATPPIPGQNGATWDDTFDWYYRAGRKKCPSLKHLAQLLGVAVGTVYNKHTLYKAQYGENSRTQ
ncbi:MAG: hypothetical protein KF893_04655 [Caldilineaceae bacterium]|nr:hypothetical protein [Caldilineaceae bacterium]